MQPNYMPSNFAAVSVFTPTDDRGQGFKTGKPLAYDKKRDTKPKRNASKERQQRQAAKAARKVNRRK